MKNQNHKSGQSFKAIVATVGRGGEVDFQLLPVHVGRFVRHRCGRLPVGRFVKNPVGQYAGDHSVQRPPVGQFEEHPPDAQPPPVGRCAGQPPALLFDSPVMIYYIFHMKKPLDYKNWLGDK